MCIRLSFSYSLFGLGADRFLKECIQVADQFPEPLAITPRHWRLTANLQLRSLRLTDVLPFLFSLTGQLNRVSKTLRQERFRIASTLRSTNTLDNLPQFLVILHCQFNFDCACIVLQVFDMFSTRYWDEICKLASAHAKFSTAGNLPSPCARIQARAN